MKNTFTLLLGMLLTVSAFASDVTFLFSNQRFDVYVDGRKISNYYSRNDNRITIRNLSYGQHRLEVFESRDNDRWNGRNSRDWNDRRLVYSRTINVRPQHDLFIRINKKGRVDIDEKRDRGRNYDDRDWNRDRDGDRGNDRDEYDNHRAMSDYDFHQLVNKINSQWFGKLGTAKDAVQREHFTSFQVRQLLTIFSAESDRLELAKLAYRNTVDQRNYSQLYDLFSYQGRSELEKYVRDYR